MPQVTFHLSKDMFLTVEARDLDTARHKKWWVTWVQKGGTLEVSGWCGSG